MLTIKRLSPGDLQPLLAFMDGPAFDSQPQWRGCYCQFYLNTQVQNDATDAKVTGNRKLACDRIESGIMQGYLAVATGEGQDRVIGWMAANSYTNLPGLGISAPGTAAIVCFVIEKEHQGRGVATALLDFAITDLPKQGFTKVQSAPLANRDFVDSGYRGPRSMFEKAGFVEIAKLDEKHVLMERIV